MSQEALADLVGVDRTTLGRIEAGKIPYNQDFIELCAELLRCEPADLLARDPHTEGAPAQVWAKLRSAPKRVQDQAVAIIETILRTAN